MEDVDLLTTRLWDPAYIMTFRTVIGRMYSHANALYMYTCFFKTICPFVTSILWVGWVKCFEVSFISLSEQHAVDIRTHRPPNLGVDYLQRIFIRAACRKSRRAKQDLQCNALKERQETHKSTVALAHLAILTSYDDWFLSKMMFGLIEPSDSRDMLCTKCEQMDVLTLYITLVPLRR